MDSNYDPSRQDPLDEDDDSQQLTFAVDIEFKKQLMQRFGGFDLFPDEEATVVKVPASFARQMHYFILRTQQEEDEEERERKYRRLREDEECARAVYHGMVAENTQSTLLNTFGQDAALQRIAAKFPLMDRGVLAFLLSESGNNEERAVKTIMETLGSSNSSDNSSSSIPTAFVAAPTTPAASATPAASTTPVACPRNIFLAPSLASGEGLHGDNKRLENPWNLEFPMEANKKYKDLADDHRKMRDDFASRAKEAHRQNDRDSSARYISKMGEHEKKIAFYLAMASAALIAGTTDSSSETLDLHFMKVPEALVVLDLFLDHHISRLAASQDETKLTIITGKGLHSPMGKPRVKPAVMQRVQQRRLRIQEVPANLGIIHVTVKRTDAMSHQFPSANY